MPARALRYDLALFSVGLIWGLNIPVMKWAVRDLSPLAFNALRFPFAIVFLGLVMRLSRNREATPAEGRWRAWPRIVLLGVLGHFSYQLLFLSGLARTTSGNSALFIATSPIFTALFAALLLRENPGKRAFLGMSVAFAGAAVISLQGSAFGVGAETWVGDGMTLLAALAWGNYTVLTRPLTRSFSPVELAFWSMLIALPGILACGIPGLEAALDAATPLHWVAIVFSGLFSIGLAYWLWNLGVQHVGPSRTAVYTYLTPVVALGVGALFLSEPLSLAQAIGGALILTGLALVRSSRRDG